MPLHIERIDWMPSPPLAPDNGPIDIDHLQRAVLGDDGLEREVLAMFSAQAAGLIDQLAVLPPHAMDLAHTLKGSALAIGAFRVADAAESLWITLRRDDGADRALMVLRDAVADARQEISGILKRS